MSNYNMMLKVNLMKSLEDLFKEDVSSLLEKNGYPVEFIGVDKTDDGFAVNYRNRNIASGKGGTMSKTISDSTQKKYALARKELEDLLYIREDFNGLIAASLFWYPCIEKAHDLLLDKDLKNFNYDAAIGHLTDVAELMAEKIYHEGYARLRLSVHKSTKEISDIEGALKKDMDSILALAGNTEKIDALLDQCGSYLNARSAEMGTSRARFRYETAQLFIMPLKDKLEDARGSTVEEKLIAAMTFVPFIKYLEKYKGSGTGY